MKILKMTSIAAALLASAGFSQVASADVTSNIGVASDYVWRGVSQSNSSASVSGGLDYSHDSGFYAGTWVGSLGETSGAETDFYFGYGFESDGIVFDLGYIYYAYTEQEDANFGEVYANASAGAFGVGIAYTVNGEASTGNQFDTGDIYYNASYGIDLSEEFALGLTIGYYDFDAGSNNDYAHIQADISKGDFTFSVSKAETESGEPDVIFIASWGTSF